MGAFYRRLVWLRRRKNFLCATIHVAESVCFATHNGERTLPILLDALTKLKQPDIPWEVVAVDNASTDATPQILREAAKKLPLRVLASPRPGKHEAIKRGAELVGGDLVLFTDDDVKPVAGLADRLCGCC